MFATARASGAGNGRIIKGWVREALGLGESETVMVSELRCTEPGCPPVETVIAVLGEQQRKLTYKIHRPTAEITREDVNRLTAFPSEHA